MVRATDTRQLGSMSFKIMAYVTTVGGCILGLRFIFFGSSVLKQWGIEATDGSLLMCRRYGALYLGLVVLFFLGRNAVPSDLRSAVCLGIGGAIALLAGLGLWEFSAGRVTSGIIVPAIVEAVLAAGFVWAWWNGR